MSDKESPKSAFESLNLVLAFCAIAISGASFYATYIQAEAAEKQVKAATWPYLQFGTSNVNEDNELEVSFNIQNGGVGPAHIKQFHLQYKGKSYTNVYAWFEDCCTKGALLIKRISNSPIGDTAGIPVTGSVANSLLSANQEKRFFKMVATDENRVLWEEINTERHKLSATACYCSLLDNCYKTNFKDNPAEVNSCKE